MNTNERNAILDELIVIIVEWVANKVSGREADLAIDRAARLLGEDNLLHMLNLRKKELSAENEHYSH